jgi:predicted transcriptional regulator of viral defense system
MFWGEEVAFVDALTPSTAGRAGLSRSALYRGARAGRLDRIARGIYLPAEALAADWDQIEAATRRPNATICLISALAYYDLTDEIPRALDVAIPRGSRTPASTGAIAWHQFDRATFEIGREQITIPGSDQTIGIYSPERSLADAFRLRGDIGYELARDALRQWLRRGGQPARLIEIASRLPRAKSPVLHALQVLG